MQTQKILYVIAAILAIFGVLIGFGAFKTEHTSPNAAGVIMVVGNIFDFGSDENSAVVYALDAATGATLWQRPMHRPVFGALTLAGGVVWHTTIDGIVHGLDATTGIELWNAAPGGDDLLGNAKRANQPARDQRNRRTGKPLRDLQKRDAR